MADEENGRAAWLARVHDDERTSERHYAAAELIAHSPNVPEEHVTAADDLVRWKHLLRNEDGTYVPVDSRWML